MRLAEAFGWIDEGVTDRLLASRLMGIFGIILTGFLLASCSAGTPLSAIIYPNLVQAREEGFHLISGHSPFTVDFNAEVKGGSGAVSYTWDLDGDGTIDSKALDPKPFTYQEPGEYRAALVVKGGRGQQVRVQQRIIVIGDLDWPRWRFGVTAHLDRTHGLYANDAEVERASRLISKAGIDAVRLDLPWSTVQPRSEDEYNWKDYDYLVDVSKKHGFDLLPVVGYSTKWASTVTVEREGQDQVTAPPVPEKYAWFAYKAAERYKNDIPAWEIWNEPNSGGFWYPEANPAVYADLLRNTYLAIKYADPQAVVVLGGLASGGGGRMPPEQFLQGVYDAGGGDYFDAVGRHPYAHGLLDVYKLDQQLDELRTVMLDNGDSRKPIWLTEFGSSAVPSAAITDQTQATLLTQSLEEFASLDYVPVVFWYNFREKGTDQTNYEHNFGLVESDWTIKPAYGAYEDYIANDPRGRSSFGGP